MKKQNKIDKIEGKLDESCQLLQMHASKNGGSAEIIPDLQNNGNVTINMYNVTFQNLNFAGNKEPENINEIKNESGPKSSGIFNFQNTSRPLTKQKNHRIPQKPAVWKYKPQENSYNNFKEK